MHKPNDNLMKQFYNKLFPALGAGLVPPPTLKFVPAPLSSGTHYFTELIQSMAYSFWTNLIQPFFMTSYLNYNTLFKKEFLTEVLRQLLRHNYAIL